MSKTVQERLNLKGGAQLPAVTGHPLATDGSGNLVATARSQVVFSTGSLAASASENDDVAMASISTCLKLGTNRPARVRAYATSAYRTADASRGSTADPTGDHGCLLEVITATGVLSVTLAPAITLQNEDSPTVAGTIYWRVQNLDTGAGVVTVTLTVLQEE